VQNWSDSGCYKNSASRGWAMPVARDLTCEPAAAAAAAAAEEWSLNCSYQGRSGRID
jgi:hypothetical protein